MRLPIPSDARVLEVGAGDSPSPRSDILVDFALEARERQGGRIRRDDRPLVLARGEALPFRDKAFDYAIASMSSSTASIRSSSSPNCSASPLPATSKPQACGRNACGHSPFIARKSPPSPTPTVRCW